MSVNVVNKSTGALTKVAGNAITEASGINYSHTTSGMSATNVQDAIDESYSELKSGFTNLDNEVNGDATTYPYADVITIEDAIPANLADCSVKIEPDQNLHGYDKPWVGGALNVVNEYQYSETVDNITVEYSLDGSFLVNGSTGANDISVPNTLQAQSYHLLSTISAGTYTPYISDITGVSLEVVDSNRTIISSGETFTVTESTNIFLRLRMAANTTFDNVTGYLQLVSGSVALPYSNECPITGHTEARVERDGVNLFDESAVIDGKVIDFNTGRLITHASYYTSDYIPVISGDKYTFSGICLKNSGEQWWYDKDKQPLQLANNNATKTVPNGAYYFRFSRSISDGYVGQIEKGETATPYVPYAGKTYTIALGDTIYGGTVDFDSGVMTVTHGFAKVSDLTWRAQVSDYAKFYAVIDNIKYVNDEHTVMSDIYPSYSNADKPRFVDGCYVGSGGDSVMIKVYDMEYPNTSDLNDWETARANNEFCYELATPFAIQLTPTQIQLLKGTNTLTASTGQISVTVNGVSGAIGAVQSEVNELASDKQDKTDNTLTTTNKTIVGAINEHEGDIDSLKSGLNDLNSLFVIDSINGHYSVNANSGDYINLYAVANTKTGYTPVGILGYRFNNPNVYASSLILENSDYGCNIFNTSNKDITNTAYNATILYRKS